MSINALTTGTQVYSSLATKAKTSVARENNSRVKMGSDRVEISAQGKRMAESTGNTDLSKMLDSFMDGAGKDGFITLDEILAFGEKYREKANQVLAETCKALGIPSDTKITVSSDDKGNIKVNADLPESRIKELEQALNNHPDFQQHYAKAASAFSLYKAGQQHLEFAAAYEKNPKAAVAGFSGKNSSDFILEYLNTNSKMVQK